MYIIKTHDGQSLSLKQEDPEVIKKLAKELELIAVTLTNGTITFLSKGTVARLETSAQQQYKTPESRQIDAPDYRGQDSAAKEKLREMFNNKDIGGMR
jgi:hypothetical protein